MNQSSRYKKNHEGGNGGVVNILIGGDVCPVKRYEPLFKSGQICDYLNNFCNEFIDADVSMINLECPLIDKSSPIVKSGPVLGANVECIDGLNSLGVDLISLANNHIMDHGDAGLKSTLAACAKKSIACVGAGENLTDASRIYSIDIRGLTVGVMSLAEHEFSIATESTYGAAPLDIIENTKSIIEFKNDADYLIILLHGGNEHYQYPSPRLQKECRFLVDMGADAIFVQHSHCVGSYEEYNGGHILYGQGNFIFDPKGKPDTFCEGLLAKLSISRDGSSIEFIPFSQTRENVGIIRMSSEQLDTFSNQFKMRSERTQDKHFIQSSWNKYCSEKKHEYLSYLLGHNKITRVLNSKGLLSGVLYNEKLYTSIKNIILCESHWDVLREILEDDYASIVKKGV